MNPIAEVPPPTTTTSLVAEVLGSTEVEVCSVPAGELPVPG